jgi:hypothetical protein
MSKGTRFSHYEQSSLKNVHAHGQQQNVHVFLRSSLKTAVTAELNHELPDHKDAIRKKNQQ